MFLFLSTVSNYKHNILNIFLNSKFRVNRQLFSEIMLYLLPTSIVAQTFLYVFLYCFDNNLHRLGTVFEHY